MANTIEQFEWNVVKKEGSILKADDILPPETDVQSVLVSRDHSARTKTESKERPRDFNVWILGVPLYQGTDEDLPDDKKLRDRAFERQKENGKKGRFIYYRKFPYTELKYELAEAYPKHGEVYSFSVPDLVVVYGGKGYRDDEPEDHFSKLYLENEMRPIRDIRIAADSTLFYFLPSGGRIDCGWSEQFLDQNILGKKWREVVFGDSEVTEELAMELAASSLLMEDRDWSVLSKAFDEYSLSGDERLLDKALPPGRVKRAIELAKRYCLEWNAKSIFRGPVPSKSVVDPEKEAAFIGRMARIGGILSSLSGQEDFENVRKNVFQAFKKTVDEGVGEYRSFIELDKAEQRLLQPIVVAVGPSVRFREKSLLSGADGVLPELSEEGMEKLVALSARMRSSPASIASERLRRNKSEFYRSVEGDIESRAEHTAETEKEVIILSSLFEKVGAKKVLDVGCGYGRLSLPLSRRGFDVTGIDGSRILLDRAKQKKGSRRNLHYKKGDLIEYQDTVPKGSVDAVYYGWHSFLEAYGIGNSLSTLRSAYAALRPGGIVTFDQPSRENSGMDDGWYGDESHGYLAYLMDEEELDLVLHLAGFEDLHIHKWTTKPTELYPEGMKKWTIVARKPEVKESDDKWWLDKENNLKNMEQIPKISELPEALSREQWDKLIESLGVLYQSLRERLSQDAVFSEKYEFERREFLNNLTDIKRSLGEAEFQKYAAYHWFIGSTTNYQQSPKGDFPGKYSIEAFLERCLRDEFTLWDELSWMRKNE